MSALTVAVVHDYLNQMGGAERVALELARAFPGAPLYTSLYRPESTFAEFRGFDIRTSPLQHAPVDRRFRALLPLYPAAFRAFGTLDADVVVSSSSGWAHGVRTKPGSVHVVYCHAPARWLYETDRYVTDSAGRRMAAPLFGALRTWDQRAAARADVYVANSENTREKIARAYGRESTLIPPPVDVDRFTPSPRGTRLLVVSRLIAYKRVDLAVQAATRLGIGLDVVGEGPELAALRSLAGPEVTFHGRAPDATVTELMQHCAAFLLPGKEDFGITPVEAQAAGKPVVAFAAGGALETVLDGVTGVFFQEASVDALVEAIRSPRRRRRSPRPHGASRVRRSPPRCTTSSLRHALRRARRRPRRGRRGRTPARARGPRGRWWPHDRGRRAARAPRGSTRARHAGRAGGRRCRG
jgi:glycosyltransferase involved in cell wall biosynthesis